MQTLASFDAKWSHPQSRPDQIAPKELDEAQAVLGLALPSTYRAAILELGLPRPTASLLRSIVEADVDLPDVSEFLSPAEILSITRGWRELGLPAHLIAFASDCMGNLFCFDGLRAHEQEGVWFFEHEGGETRFLAPTFEAWLKSYLDLTFVSFED